MNLEQICVSLTWAKKLEKAGYPQKSLFYWRKYSLAKKPALYQIPEGMELGVLSGKLEFEYAAPTGSELGKVLPDYFIDDENGLSFELEIKKEGGEWEIDYVQGNYDCSVGKISDKSLANALAKMWLYLKENGLL